MSDTQEWLLRVYVYHKEEISICYSLNDAVIHAWGIYDGGYGAPSAIICPDGTLIDHEELMMRIRAHDDTYAVARSARDDSEYQAKQQLIAAAWIEYANAIIGLTQEEIAIKREELEKVIK